MYTILALALLTNSYDMIGEPLPAQSLVMIGCAPIVKPLLEEEADEEPCEPPTGDVADLNTVVLYVDFDDGPTMQRLYQDTNNVEGLIFKYRGQDRIPAEGHRYLAKSRAKLPLLQYHTDRGWFFSAGWPGAFKFAQRWVAGNPGKEIQTHNQDLAVRSGNGASGNASVGYPIRGGWWNGCPNWTHLTQGQHAGKFDSAWLQTLSNPEIQSLHSDDHEGRVNQSYVNRTQRVNTVAAAPKAKAKPKASGSYRVRGGYFCPSGNCPWASS